MVLSDAQIDRYSRQILVPEIGGRGQERLLASVVACAGESLLVGVATQYLTAAGVTVHRLATLAGDRTDDCDVLVSAAPMSSWRQGQPANGDLPLMLTSDDLSSAWYSRSTRARDCRRCIDDAGRHAVSSLPRRVPPLGTSRAGGAALALDVIRELLGGGGTTDVVAFARGGLDRRIGKVDLAACPHAVTGMIGSD